MKSQRFPLIGPVLFVAVLFFFSGLSAQEAPQRVEPPFWWSGMIHTELQIMVHAPDIGLSRVSVDHPDVRIQEVVAVGSPNYLFVYLDLKGVDPGVFRIDFYADGHLRYSYDYELRAREVDSRYRVGFDRKRFKKIKCFSSSVERMERLLRRFEMRDGSFVSIENSQKFFSP